MIHGKLGTMAGSGEGTRYVILCIAFELLHLEALFFYHYLNESTIRKYVQM